MQRSWTIHICIMLWQPVQLLAGMKRKRGHPDAGRLWCRDDVVELMKDDLYVVRYNPIKDLLRDNWVELI